MSVYTSSALTTDYGSRFGVKPDLIVPHHAAMQSLPGLVALMQPGGRTVSAHAAIGGSQIINTVPESERSFSLGAAVFERRVLSAECVNSAGAPGWPLADDTHESIARWVADVAQRWGIWPHRTGNPRDWTIIGHREVYTIHGQGYATACPGGMNLDWIVQRAQQIMRPTLDKETSMPVLVPLVVGNPPRVNGDYALVGDGGVVGLRAKEDADLINIAKRAMLDGEPIYGNQADQLQALFARVAVKATSGLDMSALLAEFKKQIDAAVADAIAKVTAPEYTGTLEIKPKPRK